LFILSFMANTNEANAMDNGTGHKDFVDEASGAALARRWAVQEDQLTWRHELHAQIMDAFSKTDPREVWESLRECKATINDWIADLDPRIVAAQKAGELGPIGEGKLSPELAAQVEAARLENATEAEHDLAVTG
jgi:hypothetical protein